MVVWVLTCALAACAAGPEPEPAIAPGTGAAVEAPAEPPPESVPTHASAPEPEPTRPAWLGTRVLPLRPDGFGEVQPTPPELVDRRLPPSWTVAAAPGPPTISEVPDDVAMRSTWAPRCPVTLADLRYLTVPFWGFDDRAHAGELLVHRSAAEALAGVFTRLYEARFPIEEMRVVAREELDAPPTGDGNNTTGFVCRPARGTASWSQHAHGLAVDVNPFHNPYHRGDVVLPELAGAYLDRADHRPGMIRPGDVVMTAFVEIGWGWGGSWRGFPDYMHFSANGR